MHIKSSLYSSRLEILTSKKLTFVFYFISGLTILAWWVIASYQFFRAYFTLGEFDVTSSKFIVITLVFFLPFACTGAYLFSVAVQRIRVSIWLRSHLSYAEYEPYVDPPTAGFIIDYEFSNEEIWALVFYLWRKNILDITVQGKELIIRKLPKTTVNGLDIIERAFTDELFGMNGNYVVNSLHDRSFLRAGRMSHDVLAQYLLARGFDTAYLKPNKAIKNFARIVFFVAGFVGILLFSATIFDYEHVFTVAYPRYPVAPVQIIALSFVWLSVLAVIFFGFLGSFTKSRYSEVVITIARAEGYKNFLKTVYSAKFAEDKINTLPTNELIQIAPYMIAFKLVPLKMEYIRNLIKTINDKKGN